MILMGFRYLSSSIPSTSSTGAAIGAGATPAPSTLPTRRNPPTSNTSARRAPIGPPSAEAPGLTGPAHSPPISYAFITIDPSNLTCLHPL